MGFSASKKIPRGCNVRIAFIKSALLMLFVGLAIAMLGGGKNQ